MPRCGRRQRPDALAADPRAESSSGAARAPAPVTAVRRSIARRSISWDIFVLPPIDRTVRPLKVVDPQVTPDPQVTACIADKSWMPARAVTRLRVLPVPPGRGLADRKSVGEGKRVEVGW